MSYRCFCVSLRNQECPTMPQSLLWHLTCLETPECVVLMFALSLTRDPRNWILGCSILLIISLFVSLLFWFCLPLTNSLSNELLAFFAVHQSCIARPRLVNKMKLSAIEEAGTKPKSVTDFSKWTWFSVFEIQSQRTLRGTNVF
jgi:hypothetical protein